MYRLQKTEYCYKKGSLPFIDKMLDKLAEHPHLCFVDGYLIRATVGSAESTKFVSYIPPTAVVKLLQHSGLGSKTGMGFHPKNDLHQC